MITFSPRVEGKLASTDSSSLNFQRRNRNNNMLALFQAFFKSTSKRFLMPTESDGHE